MFEIMQFGTRSVVQTSLVHDKQQQQVDDFKTCENWSLSETHGAVEAESTELHCEGSEELEIDRKSGVAPSR